jgi:hypothetical protein
LELSADDINAAYAATAISACRRFVGSSSKRLPAANMHLGY